MQRKQVMEQERTVRDAVQRISFCRSLSGATLDALSKVAFVRHCPRGTVVTLEGAPAEAMYAVLRGQVKVVRLSSDGHEQILHRIRPGDHFNAVPILDGGPCPATTEATEETDLVVLPAPAMEEVVQAYPDLARALLKEVAGRLRSLVSLVEDLGLHTVPERLARLLLRETLATGSDVVFQGQSYVELAAQLGTVREVVSRTLKHFAAEGLIATGAHDSIRVIDRAGLERRAAWRQPAP